MKKALVITLFFTQKPWGKIEGSNLTPLNDGTFLSFCINLSEGCTPKEIDTNKGRVVGIEDGT